MKQTMLSVAALIAMCAFAHTASAQQEQTKMPVFKNEQEKTEWIRQHPAEYQEMKDECLKHATEKTQYVNAPGFPAYESTGNKKQDDAKYREAKDQWIKNNPEMYNKLKSSQHK